MQSKPRDIIALIAAALVTVTLAAFPAMSQNQPPPPIPREQVSYLGDPTAPTDFSGPWRLVVDATPKSPNGSKEGWRPWPPPLKPAFAAIWKTHLADTAADKSDDPTIGCMPGGMPRFITADTTPMLIVQTHGRVLFYRDGEGPRRIWLDGRAFPDPADLEDFLKGTGLGHYDGGDLVIETRGIKTQPIDSTGVPHSDKLVIRERYHKVDDQTMKVDITLTDPTAYTRPMTNSMIYKRITDPAWEPVEFICIPKTGYHPDKYVHRESAR